RLPVGVCGLWTGLPGPVQHGSPAARPAPAAVHALSADRAVHRVARGGSLPGAGPLPAPPRADAGRRLLRRPCRQPARDPARRALDALSADLSPERYVESRGLPRGLTRRVGPVPVLHGALHVRVARDST